jgi:RHS repeat-associated protein
VDHLGSPRLITNSTDFTASTQSFAPFGAGGASNSGALQFTGQERDAANLGGGAVALPDYFHARYYDTDLGRFLSVDPVVDQKQAVRSPQMWNHYAYAMNNPLKYIDPTGRLVWITGTNDDKQRMLEELRLLLNNQKAAKYVSMDQFNRLTITGMSVSAWAKQFGGNATKLAALMLSKEKIGVGFSSDSATQSAGGGLFAGVSADYAQVTIDKTMFAQTRFGTLQWTDTTLAHELFGHAMSWAVGMHQDVGFIHPGAVIMYGIGAREADGMWAENQYRAETGTPLRAYYFTPGDYIPPEP